MTKPAPTADLILHRGLFTTLARTHPTATAVAIRGGRYLAVGADKERPPGECKSDAGGRGGRLDG
jgi:predicted amidohydrolase YtcJ